MQPSILAAAMRPSRKPETCCCHRHRALPAGRSSARLFRTSAMSLHLWPPTLPLRTCPILPRPHCTPQNPLSTTPLPTQRCNHTRQQHVRYEINQCPGDATVYATEVHSCSRQQCVYCEQSKHCLTQDCMHTGFLVPSRSYIGHMLWAQLFL